MREMIRRFLGLALALAITAGIVALSRAPYATGAGEGALFRLSWSGRPERIEHCRRLSEPELAERPAHMRQEVECEGYSARYVVRVRDGGVVLAEDTVTGGGLRGDRAIHMLRDFPLAAGSHHIVVEVMRADSIVAEPEGAGPTGEDHEESIWRPGVADRERRERDELRRQRQDRLPPRLQFEATIRFEPGMVLLVSYDPIGRRLVGRGG